VESRCVIATSLSLGDTAWQAELTLTDRSSMLFRMLLGRNAIGNRFFINPAASYLKGSRPKLATFYP
ncbi:hypothetical protein TI03_04435, partial [Achromatium sp. WMS1]